MNPSGPQAPKPNGPANVLSLLAQSPDKWVQLGTLALISLSGLGNWAATWNSSNQTKDEISHGQERIRQEVIAQVRDIHQWVNDSKEEFHRANQDSASNKRLLIKLSDQIDDIEHRLTKTPPQ
jgi:hypothetical protein